MKSVWLSLYIGMGRYELYVCIGCCEVLHVTAAGEYNYSKPDNWLTKQYSLAGI